MQNLNNTQSQMGNPFEPVNNNNNKFSVPNFPGLGNRASISTHYSSNNKKKPEFINYEDCDNEERLFNEGNSINEE